jgi:predicted small lipoprotein YifL
MRRSLLLLSCCLAFALLTACGNKGPLVYAPTKPAPTSSTALPAAPATAASSGLPVESQR